VAHLKTKRPVISRFTGPETLSTAIRRGGAAPCEALPRTYPQWVVQFNTVFRKAVEGSSYNYDIYGVRTNLIEGKQPHVIITDQTVG
jgi:hypothetical protein